MLTIERPMQKWGKIRGNGWREWNRIYFLQPVTGFLTAFCVIAHKRLIKAMAADFGYGWWLLHVGPKLNL